jgi:hypothetical protein
MGWTKRPNLRDYSSANTLNPYRSGIAGTFLVSNWPIFASSENRFLVRYAALSKEGLITYNGAGKQWTEKIGDAGVKSRKVLPVYGYLNALKEIAGELYACGGAGRYIGVAKINGAILRGTFVKVRQNCRAPCH